MRLILSYFNCHPRRRSDSEGNIRGSREITWIPAGVYPVMRYGAGMTEKRHNSLLNYWPNLQIIF